MASEAADCRVICPYYLSHSYMRLHCLWLGGRVLTQRFPTSSRRIRHLNRFCCTWSYSRCPLAAVMEAWYARDSKAKAAPCGDKAKEAGEKEQCERQ